MLDWLNNIPFWAVLSVMPALVVFELFVTTSKMTVKQQKVLLSKSWLIFGVLFPFAWGLEASRNTTEIVLLILLSGYFGVFKPWKFKSISKGS